MKHQLYVFVLLCFTLSSCSQKTYTRLLREQTVTTSEETPYFLPKHVLKLELTYTLNEPRVLKNGIDLALTSSSTKITIEDPIIVTPILVADTSKTFIASGKALPESVFFNPDEKTNGQEKILRIPSTKMKAYNGLPSASLTDSSIEVEAYSAVLELMENIDKISNKDEADMALKLISFYKSQFTLLNENFKPYLKKSKLKYTVIIDPTALYSEEGRWSNIAGNKMYHTIFPKHIFKGKGNLSEQLTFEFSQPEPSERPQFINEQPIEGIVYRTPAEANFKFAVETVFEEFRDLELAQFGASKTISIKALEKGEDMPVVLFKSEDVEKNRNFETKVEALDFDSAKIMEISQEEIKREYEEKLKFIGLLIKKVQARKAEL
ncbi:hypothetical protein [Winogradskyella arenosi]|uniref:Lipoprotein n=1 Tax=Winogradskyella arenosi TaxID=533325 RepID=A0A368ZG11_9FLAO|nr:hypothetical protein [Winogradskyella arenosi]RCW92456.1 hypothetical protein DFQ08_102481 [Winogradskyella arenosi]